MTVEQLPLGKHIELSGLPIYTQTKHTHTHTHTHTHSVIAVLTTAMAGEGVSNDEGGCL